MAAASPVDVAVNPNDSDQRYILWGNGRVDAIGGAPPITSGPAWHDRIDQPIGVALHIADWATGAGYILDMAGGFQPINGAPTLGTDPEGVNVGALGVPYTNNRRYVDWSWNPDGSGQAVVLDHYGQLYAFNGAPTPPRSGPRWSWPAGRKLAMQWTPGDVRAITMDLYGGLNGDYALSYQKFGPWPGWDAARDLAIVDFAPPAGYILDLFGWSNPFGDVAAPNGMHPYQRGADVARTFTVLSVDDPARFWMVWSGGQQFEWVGSTPPTVLAGGISESPAAVVTDTTRPTLAWSYSDPQDDSQAAWELFVFTQAYVTANAVTDPAEHDANALVALSGVDPARRGAVADYDFPNGDYRFYVRAQDSAGQWSDWDDRGWTQNVPAPATPTNLTATPAPATFSVTLSVECEPGSADTVAFGYSDDAGTTWGLVRGAEAVTLTATTTAVDYDIPLAGERMYRAVSYNDSPRVVSAASDTASASLDLPAYVLTATDNASLGGELRVQEPVEFTRSSPAGVFEPVGNEFPTVVSDGTPKARRGTVHILSPDAETWAVIDALASANSTILYRDPRGRAIYCRLVGDWSQSQVEGAGLRHLDMTSLPLVEVAQPTTLPVAGTVPPGPTRP